MATEEKITEPGVRPNVLPAMKWDEVLARAQRIADERGFPPYTAATYSVQADPHRKVAALTEDEAAVLSGFVYYWQPYLTLKAK